MNLVLDKTDPEIAAFIETEAWKDFGDLPKRFRGEIWENSAGVPMERGFANSGEAFDIQTACYLKPVQQAIRSRPYGKFVIRAAVQMLKTFGTIEEPAAYFIAHDPGDMNIYLCGDDTAFDQAKARLMPRLRTIPSVGRIITEAEQINRFDVTTAELYLPGMVLRIWPMNATTTQRMTLRYVLISDAFLSGKTGIIDQAIRRTTQHNTKQFKDYKIIVESQGGEDGDDFDSQWQETDQGAIQVVCPECACGQPFAWHRERIQSVGHPKITNDNPQIRDTFKGEIFRAIPPKSVPSLDWNSWSEHHTKILLSNERRHAGMKRGDETTKRADGNYHEQEVMRQTYYECYYCGSSWHDTTATRQLLDETCYYVPENPTALPENIGFSWPSWAGQRLPWGGEQNMLGYLRAYRKKQEFGNEEALKQWYQKSAAKSWNPNLLKQLRASSQSSYDIQSDWPEEVKGLRCLVVDCQQDLQYFWASVWAVSRTGKSRQLWRGVLKGFGDKTKDWGLQLDTVEGKQREFKVDYHHVFLDGRYMKKELVEECAKRGRWRSLPDGKKEWFCWSLLLGHKAKDFTHRSDKDSKIRHPVSDPFYENPSVVMDKYMVRVEVYYFSALQMGDMAARYRDGRGPETLFLPETEDIGNRLSWTAQINACFKEQIHSKVDGSVIEVWKPPTQTTPHHYWDILRMFMCVLTIMGLSGHASSRPPAAENE